MKNRETGVLSIGILSTSLYDRYQNAILSGIQYQASIQGARTLCFVGEAFDSPDILPESRDALYELINPHTVDVLLLLSGCLEIHTGTAGLIQFLKEHFAIPFVCIGNEVEGVTSVVIDNEVGMKKLVSHMIEIHECKKIAFIKGPESNDEANARFIGYKKSLAEHDLPFDPDLVSPGGFDVDSGPNGVSYLVDEKKVKFDALIGADDLTVLHAIEPLKQRGFKIPEDVKVAGFDDVEYSQSSTPSLTTVRQPLFELGRVGVKSVFDHINGKSVPLLQTLPTNLIIRNSCNCSSDKILKLIPKGKKPLSNNKMYPEDLSASILSKLEDTYGFDFSASESDDLYSKLKHLLSAIIESLTSQSSEKKINFVIEDTVSAFFERGFSLSLWREIFNCIFEELSCNIPAGIEKSALIPLWYESLLSLYQVELFLQSQNKTSLELEEDLIRWIGNQLNVSFDIDEIKSILSQFLPSVNIQECYLSIYEKEREKAGLIYALNGKYAKADQKIIFPSKDLIPGGLPPVAGSSYCVLPLESERGQLGFEIFKLTDTNGKKYQNLAEKVASAINISMLIEKIRQQNIALRKSEEDLQITLNSIGDAVIATDAKGRITRMNPVAEELTGWKALEASGRSLMNVFRIVDAESRMEIESPVNKVIQEGNVIDLSSDTILIAKDKTERRIANSGAPIRNPQGEIVGVVLVLRDITKQFRMEEELRQAQKMDSIGQLAGGVAHDFNNMLAGISGAAELIAFKAVKDERIAKFVDMILDTTNKAADLNQKLLAFSRKSKPQYIAVNVHDCLVDTVKILEHSIDRRVTINMELKAEVSTVKGDPSQIENIVLNLGLNARDAMPSGGELALATANVDLNDEYCRISQFEIEPGPFIEISVRDTGIGMSKETLKRIFDPFYTTKEVGKGTGLGLSAVYGMVSDHHGAIDVYSKLNKGTVFKVYLPSDESAVVPEKTDKDKIETGSGCILIVDDELLIRDTLEVLLSDLGYEVILAKDGEEGVEIYKEKQRDINLVILDMVMPKMSGYDTFKTMKEINPDVKILLSSGFSRDADMEELQQEGALGFIQKPYSHAELSKTLVKEMRV